MYPFFCPLVYQNQRKNIKSKSNEYNVTSKDNYTSHLVKTDHTNCLGIFMSNEKENLIVLTFYFYDALKHHYTNVVYVEFNLWRY